MKTSACVWLLGLCLLGVVDLQPALAAPPPKPNLVLIMADDLGYETIGANGGTSYPTPSLDRLAAAGVRFTRCFAQPLCTPTRVQLMTGLSNGRNYISFGHMDPKAVTFAQLLKGAGYATCIAGKWQLGRDVDLPKKFGFDEYCLWQHTRRPPRYANPGLETNGVERDFRNGEYGPDLVNAYALDFIARKKSGPFLLYYPMMLTHGPYQPTPDSESWDPKALGENTNVAKAHFEEMVTYMDKLVGRLVSTLDELGIRENTLVLFLGDNGTGRGTVSMMGDRAVTGGKGTTTAAGMHVPLIANWPRHISGGRVCSDLIDSADFFPTLLEAAGEPIPANLKLDGRSFLSQLLGRPTQPREWIYSWYSPRQNRNLAVREFAFDQKYKLYRDGNFFDISRDVDEKTPLATDALDLEASSALTKLKKVLDQYKDVRPAEVEKLSIQELQGTPDAGKKTKKQKKK